MDFADQRVLKSTPATLSVTFVDQDGAARGPTTPVTVAVVRADGTTVAAGVVTAGTGTAVFTSALTAAHTATLDHLTCTWTATSGEVVVTLVDVVGGYGFTLADMTGLDGMSGLSLPRQRELRQAVEELVEERTGWLWTRRLVVESITSTSACRASPIWLAHRPFKVLRSVKIDGTAQTVTDWPFNEWGRSERHYGSWSWASGAQSTLELVYEAGEDRPPVSLTQALLEAAKQEHLDRTSKTSSRQLSMTNEFGQINYARATAENLFGNPTVDAVLALWDRTLPGVA